MKKFFLMLAMLLLLAVPVFAEEPQAIYTAEDLSDIKDNPYGSYVLAQDIDMTDIFWEPFCFYGNLDGDGHAILNLMITQPGEFTAPSFDGNQKMYQTSFAGMFCGLEDGQIHDLKLINVRGLVEWDQPCFLGGLTGYSRNGIISNCEISGSLELRAHDRMFGIGGAAGYGTGDIKDCIIDVTLICTDTDPETRDEQFMGGAYATGFMGVENCEIRIDGYDSDYGYVHNGGVTGMFMQAPIGIGRKATIGGNNVSGKITFFEANGDRRAYCSPVIGEQIEIFNYTIKNNKTDFKRDERFEYDRELRPEMCDAPSYTETVIPSGCDTYGYTEYECTQCGYAFTDQYRLFSHTVEKWNTVVPPTVEAPGKQEGSCVLCGAVISQEEPPLPAETLPSETETEPTETVPELPMKPKVDPRPLILGVIVVCLAVLIFLVSKLWRKEF